MKTPEEIKKGLECCMVEECFGERENCPYTADPALCVGVMCEDALAYIQHLEARVPRWIPVEERLPEDDEMYLVYTTEHTCAVYRYWGDGEWETEWGEDASHDITHWMPLPKSPEEVQHEP